MIHKKLVNSGWVERSQGIGTRQGGQFLLNNLFYFWFFNQVNYCYSENWIQFFNIRKKSIIGIAIPTSMLGSWREPQGGLGAWRNGEWDGVGKGGRLVRQKLQRPTEESASSHRVTRSAGVRKISAIDYT